MDDMDPPEQFVETVVEDIHVGIDPGEEIVTSDSTIVTSGIGMNTVVYSQGPDEIIMEGDEIGEDIVGDMVSDSLSVGKHSHILHSNSHHHHHQTAGFIMENMLDDHSIVVPNSIEPRFVAMKPQSIGEVVIGNSHVGQVILQENMGDEMIVEQNIEVGGEDDLTHGDIILVPNSMIKQEDIIEGGEVVVGSSDGNEIVIDQIGARVGNGRFFITDDGDVSAHNSMDSNFDDSRLVIDTEEQLRIEELPSVSYDCGECGALLKTRASLKKHIKMYHGFIKHKSSKSKKSAERISSNNVCMEVALPCKNRLHCCTSCSYTTQRRDKLDKHMQKHVLFEGYHPCGKKRHKPSAPPQRHHHNAEEYKCPLCPYTCTVYKALRKHNKLHIANGKHVVVKLSCKICGKDRSTETDIKKHMKKHCDGKMFMCDVCGFGSAQLKKIIQHRRMHTGEKPHLCPHCTYRSARRDNLRSHVRRMHKKENVYIDTFNPTEEPSAPE